MATPKRIKDLTPKSNFDKSFMIEVDKAGEAESKSQTLEVIVGDRQFTEENYVTNDENPTASIDKLDKKVKVNADAISALESTMGDFNESVVFTKKVPISQPEILSMYTAKKELFALPLPNKIRYIIGMFARFVFNGTPYNSVNSILIGYEGDPPFAELSSEFLESDSSVWHRAIFLSNTKMQEYKRIVAWIENTNPTDGDGFIELYITYQELGVTEIMSY